MRLKSSKINLHYGNVLTSGQMKISSRHDHYIKFNEIVIKGRNFYRVFYDNFLINIPMIVPLENVPTNAEIVHSK